MAAAVKVVFSGNHKYVVNVTGVFGGADETDTVIVDRSALTGPDGVNSPSRLEIEEITWSINGYSGIILEWDDTASGPADEMIERLSGSSYTDFRPFGRKVPTAAGSAAVGDILLTSAGGASNGNYSILLVIRLV